ncbi:beta-mannosidase-like [Acanthaster planci]|uniref:Beta-mannosidase n=1 Tax=Acanthaster planci TaxID=133434 RepID=A0A8B7YB13_ACAPL|nr:beta-mannosidase-like [Acanthaster planci]XP_022090413.1 beta-mannosidase-like [Acanthaster planci]
MEVHISLLALTLAVCFQWTGAETRIDLGGTWSLTNANKSITVPATVPGGVYTALMAAKKIDEPYMESNDVNYRWVANNNWTFSRKFNLTKEQLALKNVLLICEGLDTISMVTINGKSVGKSENMFIRYEFNVKNVLKEGTNTISVAFSSAVKYAQSQWKAHTAYDVPPDCPPDVQHGICHPNFIRKEQSSFGWDWGPAFAPQAIWKNIRIETFDCAVIRDVVATAVPWNKKFYVRPWSINITIHFELGSNAACKGTLTAGFPQLSVSKTTPVALTKQETTASMQFQVQNAETWWPAGFGTQPLYDLNIRFESSDKPTENSTKSLKFGFRYVELVQTEVPNSKGLSFYFKINTLPVFIKGANWIPADAFQERIGRDHLANLLQSLVDANMHATRVWGGGVYEQDAFYEICDQLGILVWQDLQFACAMYPVGAAFLSSVTEEVVQQVRRLSSHPSVIAWSANNENEVALRQNWYGTAKNFSLYQKDYVTLYVNTILKALNEENAILPSVSSSPSNGPESQKEGWVAKDPTDPHYGDVHYYNYAADCWDVSVYPKPRFASEYGFQSWPSFDTLRPVSKEGDWALNSSFSEHRQHHANGNKQMMMQIQRHFKDSTSANATQKFIDRIYLTQISQALCYKFETEHYRRLQSTIVAGEGMTMGAVYWQLNDIWQAPSWASIEYGGKWKMLHYYAKDFFAPLLASGVEDDKGVLSVYVITDSERILQGLLNVTVWAWASQTPLRSVTKQFQQFAQSAKPVLVQKMTEILSPNCPKREACYLTFQVTGTQPRLTSPVNPFYLSSFKDAEGIKQAHIKFEVSKGANDTFNIRLMSDTTAPFVWLDAHSIRGRFSNNGFLMNQKQRMEVFHSWESTTLGALTKVLTVSSLMDIYLD